ncbi:MAG: hypothetical protein JNJ83_23685 [Verrucomicrobiaceae bacterium]|nr:hypothetical protein [Verrucomicrobiaceae bacterium]
MKNWSLILIASLAATIAAWWLAGPSAFVDEGEHRVGAPPTATIKIARLRPLPPSVRFSQPISSFKREERTTPNGAASRFMELLASDPPDTTKLAGFLSRHGRSVESLLAAWVITKDRRLIEEALKKAPNDPRILKALIEVAEQGDERRKAIEAYRLARPESVDAVLLTAHEALKKGDAQTALDELLAVEDRLGFATQTLDDEMAQALVVEGWIAAGMTLEEAKLMTLFGESKPMLAVHTQLGKAVVEWMKAYTTSGDSEASHQLAALSIRLSRAVRGKALIDDLVRSALERTTLNQMPSEWIVPGTDLTAKERLAQIAQLE